MEMPSCKKLQIFDQQRAGIYVVIDVVLRQISIFLEYSVVIVYVPGENILTQNILAKI